MEISSETNIFMNIGTILAVVIAIITSAVKFSSMKDNICYRLGTLEKEFTEKVIEYDKMVDESRKKIQSNDIVLAEIRTKLTAIETTLLEIRKSITK